MMGTFVTLALPKEHQALLQEGFELLREIEKSLSSFDADADIYRLNHQKRLHVSDYTREAIALSQVFYKKSDGYFDITVGSLTKDVYHFGGDGNYSKEALKEAKVAMDALWVDGDVVSLKEGIKLDLGGMGKGYGVDKLYALFSKHGVKEGLIKLSGDIRCIAECEIAISDPFMPERSFATFKSRHKGLGISTSGNYRRFKGSKYFNHLIDPKLKRSEHNFASLTLIAKASNAYLDAMATAIMVMPKDRALAFLKKEALGYVLVDNDKNLYISKDLDYLVEFKLLFALKIDYANKIER